MENNATKKRRQKWGRKGGLIGGYRRALSLTPERRREIARNAARTRWAAYQGE